MRTKKAFRNLLFNLFQQIILIITNFIMPPILVQNFGSAINGLVTTIRQIMNYVQLTGAGIAHASTYAMYKPLANEDYKTLSGIYVATKNMFLKAGHWFSFLVIIVSLVYPLTLDGQVNYYTAMVLVLVISISGASEFYLCGKYQALLNANQENHIVAIAQIIGSITNMIFLILLVALKQNIIVVQLGMSSIYLLRIIILSTYVKKNYSFLDLKEKPLYDHISQRNDAIIHQISALIVVGSSTLIVSIVRGLKEASVFNVYFLVFAGVNTICSIVSSTIYSSFGDVIAKKEQDILRNSYNIYEYVFFIVVSIVFISTYILIMPFIKLYTVNMTDANYYLPSLAVLFIIVGIANNVRNPGLTLVDGAGHFKETRNRALIEMTLSLIGQLFFGYIYGLHGVLLGSIISYSYRTIDFILYSNKYILKQSPKKTFKRIGLNVLFGIVLAVLLKHFLSYTILSYLDWVVYAIVITIITSVAVLLFNYIIDKKTFKECFFVIKSIIN